MGRPIIFLDLYCGAGGYSTGFAEAMRELGLTFYEIALGARKLKVTKDEADA